MAVVVAPGSRAVTRPRGGLACLCLALLLCAGVQADPDRHSRSEIEFLLIQVRDSGCLFIRNGSSYDGAKAVAHLRAKYASARASGRINSTDDFIRLIASASSLTGRVYLIQCGSRTPVPTRRWLEDKLATQPILGDE